MRMLRMADGTVICTVISDNKMMGYFRPGFSVWGGSNVITNCVCYRNTLIPYTIYRRRPSWPLRWEPDLIATLDAWIGEQWATKATSGAATGADARHHRHRRSPLLVR